MKTRASLAAGSYHVNSDGTDISGITFPVKSVIWLLDREIYTDYR